VSTQENAAIAYCEGRGYRIHDVVREAHTGQELWERDLLTAVRARIRRGEVDILIAYSIDRLARDPDHQAIIISEALHHRCEVEFVSEPKDDSPEAGLIRYVKGYAGQREAKALGERTMRGRRGRVLSGKLQGQGAWLYGCHYDHGSGTRSVDEPRAAIVREIYQLALAGQSDRGIARLLNARGVASPSVGYRTPRDPARADRRAFWDHSVIASILTNPAYKGEAWQFRWKWERHGKSKLRPPEEWVRLPEGTTPAIVEPATWDAVQQRRAERIGPARGSETRNVERPYLLRGRLRCGVCGCSYQPSPSGGRAYYRCGSRTTAAGACGASMVVASRLDEWVWSQVLLRLKDRELIMAEYRRLSEQQEAPNADISAVKRELGRIVREQDRLLERYRRAGGDGFPWDLVERQIRQLQAERNRLEAELVGLEERHARWRAPLAAIEEVIALCEAVGDVLDGLPFQQRRLLLEAMEVRVTVGGPEGWSLAGVVPVNGHTPAGAFGTGDLGASA